MVSTFIRHHLLVLAGLVGPMACSGASPAALKITGTQGQPIAATNLVDTLVVALSVNGVAGATIVDTGAPIVALDPSAFTGADLPDGSGTVKTLSVGLLTVDDATVVGADLVVSPDPTMPIGGSLGCAVLCDIPAVSLNYRDALVTLGQGSLPNNVEDPGASIPFTLEGGGMVMLAGVPGNIQFPRSRIAVSVTIEGQAHSFIVDTGDSFVTVRQSIFAALTADGRTQIGDINTATVGPSSTSSVTRLRSMSVGGAELFGIVASYDSAIEATLDSVATEVGHEVDGLVGGSFLRQFYVTIGYANTTLELRRYTSGAPTFDSFDRVGVAISPANGAVPATVTEVISGTDAETLGIAVGDQIVSIDGQMLASLGATAVDGLLCGPVGSTKTVQFATTSSPQLSMKTVPVVVDDILAL